jgi:hypothetical protein
MDFEDNIKNINDKSFVNRRTNQFKYLIFESLSESMGIPKSDISIDMRPLLHHSQHSNRFTDVWTIEFYLDLKIEVDPGLSDIAFVFNRLEKSLYQVFKDVGVNQFLEFVKNPDSDTQSVGVFVSGIEFDIPFVKLRIDIDYETITVEGASDL